MAKFSVSYVYKIVDKYTKPLRKIAKQTDKYRKALNRAAAAAKKLARGLAKVVSRSIKAAATGVARLASRFGALTGVIGLASAALASFSAYRLVNNFAAATDELGKFSRQVGLSAADLQKLQFIADRQGVSAESLRASLQGLGKTIGELKIDRGPLVEYLKKSNPALLQQLKGAKDLKAAFNIVMTTMGQMKNPTERAAFAQAAFTRTGLSMARIAEAGAPAIKKLADRFEYLRGTLTPKDIANAEAYQDSLTNLGTAVSGWSDAVAKKLLPVLTPIIDKLTEWIAANRSIVAQRFGDFIDGIGRSLQKYSIDEIFSSISAAMKGFDAGNFAKQFLQATVAIGSLAATISTFLVKYWKPLLVGFASFKGVSIIMGVAIALAATFGSLALIIGAVVSAIAVLGVAVWYFWDDILKISKKVVKYLSTDLPMMIKEACATIEKAIGDMWNTVKRWYRGAVDFLYALFRVDDVTTALSNVWTTIKGWYDTIKDEINKLFTSESFLLKLFDISELEKALDKVTSTIKKWYEDTKNLFTGLFDKIKLPTWLGGESSNLGQVVAPSPTGAARHPFLARGQDQNVNVQNNMSGTIDIRIPQGASANADIRFEGGMPVGTNIVSQP